MTVIIAITEVREGIQINNKNAKENILTIMINTKLKTILHNFSN